MFMMCTVGQIIAYQLRNERSCGDNITTVALRLV